MDEIEINATMAKLQQQIENVAEDVKEIKEMLKEKSAIDAEQNKNIALLQNITTNMQQRAQACAADKESEINRLKSIVQEHHDQIQSVELSFNKYKEYQENQQNKFKWQISILIPLLTTTLTFGIDLILRFLNI